MPEGLGIPFGAIYPSAPGGDAYGAGYASGQMERANDLKLQQMQAAADQASQAQQAQELMRAMELGKSDPKQWDAAMTSLAQNGNRDAAALIGKWSPIKSAQLLRSWRDAMDVGVNRNGSITDPDQSQPAGYTPGAAPTARSGKPPAAPDYVSTAIDRMTPEERRQAAKKYNHIVNAMAGVNNEADLQAVMEDLQGRGYLTPENADQYMAAFTDPVNGWKNFQDEYEHQKLIQAHLNELNNASMFGITPVTNEPKYTVHYNDSKGEQYLETDVPGRAPTVDRIGAGGAPRSPFSNMTSEDGQGLRYESDQRDQFLKAVQPQLTAKNAISQIFSIDPKTSTGTDQLMGIYAFVKGLDPTSVVREGEISLLNNARSTFEQLFGQVKRMKQGDILLPSTIMKMQETAKTMLGIIKRSYDTRRKAFRDANKDFTGIGISPDRITPDFWGETPVKPGDGPDGDLSHLAPPPVTPKGIPSPVVKGVY